MSKELFSIDADLQSQLNEVKNYKKRLLDAEEELQTKEFQVGSYSII